MEMGSRPSGSAGDANRGLRFGEKLYFEDGGGGSGSSGKEAAAEGRRSPAKKWKGGGAHNVQQPAPAPPPPRPRCQVEGCMMDLTDAKAYYCRHKVCGVHSKSPKVVVGGMEQRFCQQCSRFHMLHEFDQEKRSCRRRLAGHNERRRKPPPPPLWSRFSPSPSLQEGGSRFRSYFMDFASSGASSDEVWPAILSGGHDQVASNWQGYFDTPPVGPPLTLLHGGSSGARPYTQGSAGGSFPTPGIPKGVCLAGDSADSSCALSLLSMQPQGASAGSLAQAGGGGNIGFDVTPPLALPPAAGHYAADPYRFGGQGPGGRIEQGSPAPVEEDGGGNDIARFSGELELALQGGMVSPDAAGGGGRGFDQSYSHGFHWSL